MPTKAALIDTAHNFLKAETEKLIEKMGKYPESIQQQSTWMVSTGSGGRSSQYFERTRFNNVAASRVYQTEIMHRKSSQKYQLVEALVAAGIPPEETTIGYLLPLLNYFFHLPDPFVFNRTNISYILNEFADTVIDDVILTKSRTAILSLDLTTESLVLEQGICIRPISNEELWQLGDTGNMALLFFSRSFGAGVPGEDWKIIDIEVKHARKRFHPPEGIESTRSAVLTALALVSPDHLQVFDLGTTANYGVGAIGTVLASEPALRHIGRRGGRYNLNKEKSKLLKASWPRIHRIVTSKQHDLRLPTLRLVDGGGRQRDNDAIVDYAIGLEALLLKGVNDELCYRFALRGATILTWDGGEKETQYIKLRDFYKIRNNIVHGSHIDPAKLQSARSNGAEALSNIWWWCFNRDEPLSRLLHEVDQRILT